MKTFTFTDEEIKLLKNALYYVYDKKLDIVKNNRKILAEDNAKAIINQANKYYDLADKLDGHK